MNSSSSKLLKKMKLLLKFLSVGYDASEIRLHPCGKLLGVNHLTMKKGRENALSLVSEFRMSPGV
jgi:hypothetical protein